MTPEGDYQLSIPGKAGGERPDSGRGRRNKRSKQSAEAMEDAVILRNDSEKSGSSTTTEAGARLAFNDDLMESKQEGIHHVSEDNGELENCPEVKSESSPGENV